MVDEEFKGRGWSDLKWLKDRLMRQWEKGEILRLAAQEPQRVHLVDAVGTPEEVFARLADALRDLFGTLEGGEA